MTVSAVAAPTVQVTDGLLDAMDAVLAGIDAFAPADRTVILDAFGAILDSLDAQGAASAG